MCSFACSALVLCFFKPLSRIGAFLGQWWLVSEAALCHLVEILMKTESVAKTRRVRDIFPCPLSAAAKPLSSMIHWFALGLSFVVNVEFVISRNMKQK